MLINEYHVYVDGSLDSKGSGAGVVVWHPWRGQIERHKIPLGTLPSSTHAEIHALVAALKLFRGRECFLEIFSDSKPAIQCLRGQVEVYRAQEIQLEARRLIEEIRRVRFHYMAAKTCLFTLEADNLAKSAVQLNPKPLMKNKNGIPIL